MKEKVLIPNRGVIALDIINSMQSAGYEAVLMHSPEDNLTLPVKLADRCYKFLASRLEDSYLDMEAIVDLGVRIGARFLHPGYGFQAENPEFARLCKANGIHFIGPEAEILRLVEDKIGLRQLASGLGIKVIPYSPLIRSPLDFEEAAAELKYPALVKPLKGSGGRGLRLAHFRREAQEQVEILLKNKNYRQQGLFCEEYLPFAHHIELPFIRDAAGRLLFLPEIESSIQRRFQKIFQESPSPNLRHDQREAMVHDAQKLLGKLNYVGLGAVEFLLQDDTILFSEINPSFQINTLIPEVHLAANFVKKQFAISRGEDLHDVSGVELFAPRHSVLLISLMAEDPFNNFRPSSGVVTDFFHYSSIRNLFKTALYTGARVSPFYDPFIGKIATFAVERDNALSDMRLFLDSIIIRGIRTNLVFLKHLLENEKLQQGETIIDFLPLHFDFARRKRGEEEIELAAALLGARFHAENRLVNYKARLEKMKQPGFFRRLFWRF